MGLRTKLIAVGVLLIVAVSAVLFYAYARQSKEAVRQQYVEKARSIVLTTESMREEMAAKWEAGIFNQDVLREWAMAGDLNRILHAVPVVSAWRAAMAKAEEGGYEFRVPKFHPRNPKNEPDELEGRVLKMLASSDLDEYQEIDPALNAVRYFRPVRLTNDCMACHGDPARSQQLWGNDEGLDATGVAMEGWKPGEVHGAFEVIQSLDEADAALAASLTNGAMLVGLLTLGAIVILYLAVTRVVYRGLINPVKQIAQELTEGAEQVNDASQQVSGASQMLAEGACKQADTLQETAGSLNDVSERSRSNAQHAQQASTLSDQTRDAAQRGDQTMQELNTAMGAINASSEQISKIVKTIEEIAFQTNLLALNAAVEAARAGEHGKGFAVVAEEVRGLARRTAEATQETNALIENAVNTTRDGGRVALQVGEALGTIVTHVNEVSELITRISGASQEQAQGVEQVNLSVGQLDRVTQQNASASEEAAAAAEELAAQSLSVKETVDRLVTIAGAR